MFLPYITPGQCTTVSASGKVTGIACGSGSANIAVTSGTANGFVGVVSSPTAVINFDSSTFKVNLKGAATAYIQIDPSSVTLQGNNLSATYLTNSSATATYLQNSSATATYLQLSSATAYYVNVSTVLAVIHGGTGTTSPGLSAGTNITSITGTWPNQTINAATQSGGGGGGGSSSLEVFSGPTRSSPTASINLDPNTFTSFIHGTTFYFTINPGTTNFIQNQKTSIQSADYSVTSGTSTQFTASTITIPSGYLTDSFSLFSANRTLFPQSDTYYQHAQLNSAIGIGQTDYYWIFASTGSTLDTGAKGGIIRLNPTNALIGYGTTIGNINGIFINSSGTTVNDPTGFNSTFGIFTSTITASAFNATSTSFTVTGPGGLAVGGTADGIVGFTIMGTTYTVWSTSGTILPGHIAIAGNTTNYTFVDGGLPGTGSGTPALPVNSIQFNIANVFTGNADFEHFISSLVYTNQFVATSTMPVILGATVATSSSAQVEIVNTGATTTNILVLATSTVGVPLVAVSTVPAKSPYDLLLNLSSPTINTNVLGVQLSGHVVSSGTTPTVTGASCGTTPRLDSGSTDVTGHITWSGVATACALTFQVPWQNAPSPYCIGVSTMSGIGPSAWDVTSTTFSFSGNTGGTITYHCEGGKGG